MHPTHLHLFPAGTTGALWIQDAHALIRMHMKYVHGLVKWDTFLQRSSYAECSSPSWQSCLRSAAPEPVLPSDAMDSRRDMLILPGVPMLSEHPNDSRRCMHTPYLSPRSGFTDPAGQTLFPVDMHRSHSSGGPLKGVTALRNASCGSLAHT